MKDLDDILVRHQREKGSKIDPHGKGVDNDRLFEARHLRDAKPRGIGAFAHEIGVGEIAGDHWVAQLLLLSAPHLPEGPIVKHDHAQRNAMMDCGRKLVRGEEKAALTRDRQSWYIAPRVLCTEGGGIAPAEVVLIARRKEGPRFVHRKQEPGGKTDLRDFVDANAIFGKLCADCLEKSELWGELLEAPAHLGLPLLHFCTARTPMLGR